MARFCRSTRPPARADCLPCARGSSAHPVAGAAVGRVHRRARGTDSAIRPSWRAGPGSSPRARGRRSVLDSLGACRRFIPASAGRSGGFPRGHPSTEGSSPCVRGCRPLAASRVALLGSSPRARGGADRYLVRAPHSGFIPRACGVFGRLRLSCNLHHGSSPRLRGADAVRNGRTKARSGSSPRPAGSLLVLAVFSSPPARTAALPASGRPRDRRRPLRRDDRQVPAAARRSPVRFSVPCFLEHEDVARAFAAQFDRVFP